MPKRRLNKQAKNNRSSRSRNNDNSQSKSQNKKMNNNHHNHRNPSKFRGTGAILRQSQSFPRIENSVAVALPPAQLLEANLRQLHKMITDSFDRTNINSNGEARSISRTFSPELLTSAAVIKRDGGQLIGEEVGGQTSSPGGDGRRKFYELVYQLIRYQNATDQVYETYDKCAGECFRKFRQQLLSSSSLEPQLDNNNGASIGADIQISLNLIQFWKQIFLQILPKTIGFAFVYPERLMLKSSKRMLLHELTCHRFSQELLLVHQVGQSLVRVFHHYIERMRQEFMRHLLDNVQTITTSAAAMNVDEIVQKSLESLKASSSSSSSTSSDLGIESSANFPINLCSSLTRLLFEMDEKNLSVFYRILELPLIEQSIAYARKLSNELINPGNIPELSMLDYLLVLDRFLNLQSKLLELFGFPADTIANMRAIFVHVMLDEKMPQIVTGNRTSFKALFHEGEFGTETVPKMANLYNAVMLIQRGGSRGGADSRLSPDQPIPAQFVQFIQNHLQSLYHDFQKEFEFQNRQNCIRFVRSVLTQIEDLDYVVRNVFASNRQIDQLITNQYVQLLSFHDRIPQALAYYLHDTCMKSSTVLPKCPPMSELMDEKKTPPPMSQEELDQEESRRCQQLSRLMGPYYQLIPYMKDHNDLFDYTKHYFCQRLMLQDAGLVEFSTTKQMIMLEELSGHIKSIYNYRESPSSAAATSAAVAAAAAAATTADSAAAKNGCFFSITETIARIDRNQSRPNYCQFSQSWKEFKTIRADFQNSDNFFENFYVKPEPGQPSTSSGSAEIDHCKILHAGIWKLVNFDQCTIPDDVYKSWEQFVTYHANHVAMKKLLLNTKHSKATVVVHGGGGQVRPSSLAAAAGSSTISGAGPSSSTSLSPPLSLTIVCTLNQLAVLVCFEPSNLIDFEDLDSSSWISYDQIKSQTKFQKEANLQVSILSLIYFGLISWRSLANQNYLESSPSSSSSSPAPTAPKTFADLQFHFDEANCFEKLKSHPQPIDISIGEHVNFSTLDHQSASSSSKSSKSPEHPSSFRKLIQKLCGGKDLLFQCSSDSVQDVNQIQRILASSSGNFDRKWVFTNQNRNPGKSSSLSKTSTAGAGAGAGGPSASSSGMDISKSSNQQLPPGSINHQQDSSLSKFSGSKFSTKIHHQDSSSLSSKSSKNLGHLSLSDSLSTSKTRTIGKVSFTAADVSPSNPNVVALNQPDPINIRSVDNLIKIECAVVRLLKRNGEKLSIFVINRKLCELLANHPAYPPEFVRQINFDLTAKVVQGLVDKKYLRQESNGTFSFIIN